MMSARSVREKDVPKDRFGAFLRWALIVSTPLLVAMREIEGGSGMGCERRVMSLEDYTAEERAAAAELVSWISYTHPLIHRVFQYEHSHVMRRDFAQIPTAYMLIPRPKTSPLTWQRYGEVVEFWTPWFSRRVSFGDFRRQSLILTGNRPGETLTAQQREAFLRHMVTSSREIIEVLSDPNRREFHEKTRRISYSGFRHAPLLEDSPATVSMSWRWYPSFSEAEFKYLAKLARRLSDARVLDLVYTRVSENFDSIVRVQRKFSELLGESVTDSAFDENFEFFRESSEYMAVAPLSAAVKLPPSSLDRSSGLGTPESQADGHPSESEDVPPATPEPRAAPPVPASEAERLIPFSAAEIEQFLNDVGPASDRPGDGVDLEQLVVQLVRVVNLINGSLASLTPWTSRPSRWIEWRDHFRPTRTGLETLTKKLRVYREQAVMAREQYLRAHRALVGLERWTELQKELVGNLTTEAAKDLSARAKSDLLAVHRDLPRISIMSKEVTSWIDQRLDVFDARLRLTTDLSLLVMNAQLRSVGEDCARECEPVSAFLRGMVDTLGPAGLEPNGAAR